MMTDEATAPMAHDEPAGWPAWVERVYDPAGGRWQVKTVDLLKAPGQFAPAEARTLALNMGRYRTTIERPDGGLRAVYLSEQDEAEAYHRRTVRRIRAGAL